MRPNLIVLSFAVLAIACGCGPRSRPGEGSTKGKLARPPAPPPSYPAQRKVPLDPRLAEAAERELTDALNSTDPIIRVHALEALPQIKGPAHNEQILHALNDPEAVVRFAAALAAGQLKLAAAHEPLLKLAEDRSENVRVAVRYALHRLGDTRLSHELEKLANDSSPRVRGNTAMVLGMLGNPSALRILHLLRIDPNPAVREQASEAMWRLGDDEGLKDLVGLTCSKFYDDQMIGYLGIALPRDDKVRQHVRGGLVLEGKNDPLEPPLVAARAMGMLGSDEGYGIAQIGAASDDPRRRSLAALAFGAIGRADAQEILRKLLADPAPGVRVAAATAILQLKA